MEEIKKIIKKNLELTEDVHRIVKKISHYLFWQQVFGILKLIIIIVPIIIAFIYLPPLLKTLMQQYQDLLGVDVNIMDSLKGGVSGLDLSEVQKMLK